MVEQIKKYTLTNFIAEKYGVSLESKSPIELPGKRQDLAKLFTDLMYLSGAEIGTHRGDYASLLCERIPNLRLFCIDIWDDELYRGTGRSWQGRNYSIAKERLSTFDCDLIQMSSMEAAAAFAPHSLDFVYIDADHAFDSVFNDITEWSKIVRLGGIVSGHDYKCYKHPEISRDVSNAVNTYAKERGIEHFFIFSGDRSTSWFYVNE